MEEACTQLELNITSIQHLKEINLFDRMKVYEIAWNDFWADWNTIYIETITIFIAHLH